MNRSGTLSLILLLTIVGTLPAQALFTSTRGSATGGPESDLQFDEREILVHAPGLGAPIRHHRNSGSLSALLGDVDGNGIFDDFDASIDALAPTPVGIDGGQIGLLFSVDRSLPTLSGTVEDGDIVSLHPGGLLVERYDEASFAVATGCSSIDVDAFHVAADGTIWFSFSADESTTSAALTAANGGNPILDETTVFTLAPGAPEAGIFYDRGQVIAMVNQAMGTTLTTVVDLTGFAPDADHPGEWLFTTGSTNSVIEGRVFSSFAGGSLATLGSGTLDSSIFGFVDEEVMESLAIGPLLEAPLSLFGPEATLAPPGFHAYEVAGATPFQLVHLIASHSLFPTPPGEDFGALLGFPWLVVNSSDPLLHASIQSLAFSDWADAQGRARVVFAILGITIGTRITMQAVDLASGRLSPPTTAWL